MKRIFSLLISLLLLAGCILPVWAEEMPAAVEAARESVVHLYGVGLDDAGIVRFRWTGSGFPVGKAGSDSDVFLTNWHVVTGNGRFDTDHVRLWILLDGAQMDPGLYPHPDYSLPCTILAATDGYPDVAVIRTTDPVSGYSPLRLLSSKRIPNGAAVYSLGFPGMSETHNGADSGPEDVVITSGSIRNRLIMTQAGRTWSLIHTARIQHGNSGGPLVNAEGTVIGLNTYGFEEETSSDLFCAVFSDYAMELLDGLGLPYETDSGIHPLPVLAMNLLHTPDLPIPAAWTAACAIALAAAVFAFYFLKTLWEVLSEMRKK